MKPWSQDWLIDARAYPISTPPGRDAGPSQVTPQQFVRLPQQFASTHLYSWVKRGTVRVKCLAQEHNRMSPARARTRTARPKDECTNHEVTAPPTLIIVTVHVTV